MFYRSTATVCCTTSLSFILVLYSFSFTGIIIDYIFNTKSTEAYTDVYLVKIYFTNVMHIYKCIGKKLNIMKGMLSIDLRPSILLEKVNLNMLFIVIFFGFETILWDLKN